MFSDYSRKILNYKVCCICGRRWNEKQWRMQINRLPVMSCGRVYELKNISNIEWNMKNLLLCTHTYYYLIQSEKVIPLPKREKNVKLHKRGCDLWIHLIFRQKILNIFNKKSDKWSIWNSFRLLGFLFSLILNWCIEKPHNIRTFLFRRIPSCMKSAQIHVII